MIWKLAWRNLWRHRARTLIALSAIFISYALLLLFMGIQADLEKSFEEAAVETAGGNVFVHADDYWATQDIERYIEDAGPIVDAAEHIDGIRGWIPRLVIHGLLETADDSVPMRLSGVDPERERLVRSPERDLVDGTFLDGHPRAPIVVGIGIAERLDVDVGDRIVMTAADPDGEIERALFYVDGIFETGADTVDDVVAWTTLEAAQRAVNMEGNLNEIAFAIDDDDRRHQIASELQSELDDAALPLRARSWDQLLPDVVAIMEFRRTIAILLFAAILLVVALAIANTFMMAVMERIRELGLLAAMGLTPGQLSRMLLFESLILAALGLVVGFLLGLGGHLWLVNTGIDVTEIMGGDIDIGGVSTIDLVVYSHIIPSWWIGATVFVFAIVLLSSIYPAFRASRLAPADAMRMSE